MTEGNVEFETKFVSPEALATLGEGHIAYVKQIRSEDVPCCSLRRRRSHRD